jgi:methylmalonyl-CoA/ethylmalonyl-CoA epimerase
MIRGMNHVGIVVRSIDEVVSFLVETFGAQEIRRVEFPELKQISSIVQIGDGCFELMEPTAPDGAAGKFLEAKGGGLHHVSLLCDDVEALCEELEAKGLKVIGKMFDRPSKLAFLHPKSGKGILYELAEKSSMDASN